MVEIVCTIGPSSDNLDTLKQMKSNGMNFARVNLSHVGLDYVKKIIRLCQEVDVPLIVDTEGAQVRTGELEKSVVVFEEGDCVEIHNEPVKGDNQRLHLRPTGVVKSLNQGDLVSIDFDSLLLKVTDTAQIGEGIVKAKVINGGVMGHNKSVIVQDPHGNKLELPVLSEKDKEVLDYAIKHGVKNIAASFMNCPEDVDYVRSYVGEGINIISKIESKVALNNLSGIIEKSDNALIDRGDLSKEISIERIPLTQKVIVRNGQKSNTPIFVATNLLESMCSNKRPTRAEVNDVVNTILDGASGLVLAGETASGDYPVECVKMISKLIKHSEIVTDVDTMAVGEKVVERLKELDYLGGDITGDLIEPHGSKLINRIVRKPLESSYLGSLPRININEYGYLDVEQIAIGTFSPLEGFMSKEDFMSVLNDMRLKSGVVWTIPIILDVDEETRSKISESEEVALAYNDEVVATMKVDEIYTFDKKDVVKKWFGTDSEDHPGVRNVNELGEYLVGGKIMLIKRGESDYKEYELTPTQTRKIFEEKGWSKIVGFHTRNVIHRSHEFIQLDAIKRGGCDGLFVHPVVGKKKKGDYNAEYIIKSYELMIQKFYPKGKVVLGAFSTFSRYAGPREAVFTAICRKNFGCSHFIVGRDHTGVKLFYQPKESHEIFDKFPDLGIKPIVYDKVFYSKKLKDYVHDNGDEDFLEEDKCHISGTQARDMFEKGEVPPEWFMRKEVSGLVFRGIRDKKEVFIK